jgi:hypothetical protein
MCHLSIKTEDIYCRLQHQWCWSLSPNPTNTHFLETSVRGFGPMLLKKKSREKIKKKIPDSENEAREGLGPSQGPDTLADRFSGTREVVRTSQPPFACSACIKQQIKHVHAFTNTDYFWSQNPKRSNSQSCWSS